MNSECLAACTHACMGDQMPNPPLNTPHVTGDATGVIRVYQSSTFELLAVKEAHDSCVSSLDFSPPTLGTAGNCSHGFLEPVILYFGRQNLLESSRWMVLCWISLEGIPSCHHIRDQTVSNGSLCVSFVSDLCLPSLLCRWVMSIYLKPGILHFRRYL